MKPRRAGASASQLMSSVILLRIVGRSPRPMAEYLACMVSMLVGMPQFTEAGSRWIYAPQRLFRQPPLLIEEGGEGDGGGFRAGFDFEDGEVAQSWHAVVAVVLTLVDGEA